LIPEIIIEDLEFEPSLLLKPAFDSIWKHVEFINLLVIIMKGNGMNKQNSCLSILEFTISSSSFF